MIRPECSGKQMERHTYDPSQAAMLFVDDRHPAPAGILDYAEFERHENEILTDSEPHVLGSHVADSADSTARVIRSSSPHDT
jgi:hypothetical protein